MIDNRTAPYAALVLRVTLGVMFIAHSLLLKYFIFTLPGTAQFFESLGLPAALAYLTFWAELIGGVLLNNAVNKMDEHTLTRTFFVAAGIMFVTFLIAGYSVKRVVVS